jgi:hypothetical protein
MQMFSDLINGVASGWEEYRTRKTTSRSHPMHQLVVNDIPSVLSAWTPQGKNYKFVGSDGQGNILRTPWFAALNKDVTESATKGYYLVYLLSDDLERLYLTIGFGASQFEERYKRSAKVFAAFDSAVINMRTNSLHLAERFLGTSHHKVNTSSVNLTDSRDFHLRAYESCSIYNIEYDLRDLPEDSLLKEDYVNFLVLYEKMSESLLLADVDSYVYELIESPPVTQKISVEEFVPFKFKTRKKINGSDVRGNTYRHSKKSDKVGKLGEEIVFNYEKQKLIDAGRDELAQKVIWHREDISNRTPGWDVTSFTPDGTKLLIEVKSSEGKKISDLELTVNEWIQAEKHSADDSYQIYLVTDVFNSAVIRVIKNPAKQVRDEKLTIDVARYQLLLGVREE